MMARSTRSSIPAYISRGQQSKEYKAFVNMRARCLLNSDSARRRWEGSKWDGMEVQAEWHDISGYADFCGHMGPAPKGTYLDRIENDKGYIKGNLRWATGVESNSNKSNNKFVEAHGLSLTLPEWSRRTGQSIGGLRYRLSHLTPDEAIHYGG